MVWTVTRQSQWPEGTRIVEISAGGLDYTNPDALAQRYDGEFEEFADPREAVTQAIDIARRWSSETALVIAIGHGATAGFTLPFEMSARIYPTGHTTGLRLLREWSAKAWENVPKCDECGKALPDDERRVFLLIDFDEKFDSEHCAERYWEKSQVVA